MSELTGKAAIVTGANRGIGRAIAIELAQSGARVLLTARDASLLAEVTAAITGAGGQAVSFAADLRLPETPERVVAAAVNEFGRIDILVNNAGATKRGDFLALTDEDWSDGFALKLFGNVRMSRSAWPHLQASSGSLVTIAGIGGRTPGPQFAIGGAVNAALLSLTKSLSDRGIQDGVQVNAINPGSVRTDRLRARVKVFAEQSGLDLEAAAARMKEEAQISRFGEPEEVAHLVSFLVSARGRWLQGALIDLDGGQTKTM